MAKNSDLVKSALSSGISASSINEAYDQVAAKMEELESQCSVVDTKTKTKTKGK